MCIRDRYGTYSLGGAALVVFVHSLVITAAYWLVACLSKMMTQSWRLAAFGTLFAAALGLNDWNVRPQAVTFLLGALFLWVIGRYRRQPDRKWLAVFPLGMLVWVNSHGTFPLGLGLIGLITVQLVKNILIPEEERYQVSYARKIKEAILAMEISRLYSKDQILDRVWSYDADVRPTVVELYISYLRKKIEKDPADPQYIFTERGLGYRFVDFKQAE